MRRGLTINFIGIYLLLWLITLILIPIVTYFYSLRDSLIRSLIYIASSGGLGGIIYLIRSFYMHIFEKNFREDAFWWYIFRPFSSVVIGVMSYFLIVGGLMSIGNVSSINYERGIMFYSGIAFLAGFSFTQFANKLEELAKTLFAKSKRDKDDA